MKPEFLFLFFLETETETVFFFCSFSVIGDPTSVVMVLVRFERAWSKILPCFVVPTASDERTWLRSRTALFRAVCLSFQVPTPAKEVIQHGTLLKSGDLNGETLFLFRIVTTENFVPALCISVWSFHWAYFLLISLSLCTLSPLSLVGLRFSWRDLLSLIFDIGKFYMIPSWSSEILIYLVFSERKIRRWVLRKLLKAQALEKGSVIRTLTSSTSRYGSVICLPKPF